MPNIPKYTLAIETATLKGSLSLLKGRDEMGFWIGDNFQMLSASLLPQISALLSENNLTIRDIELIAVSAGPGSFTGIRIGLSTAKALQTSLGIPAVAVPLPETLALSAGSSTQNVTVIIPAGREGVYWQEFRKNEAGNAAVSAVSAVTVKQADEIPEAPDTAGTFFIATSDLKAEYITLIESRAGSKVHIAGNGLARYAGEAAINRYALNGGRRDDPLSPVYVKEFRS